MEGATSWDAWAMWMASLRDRARYGVDGGDGKMKDVPQDAAAGRKTPSVSSRRRMASPVRMVLNFRLCPASGSSMWVMMRSLMRQAMHGWTLL
jgi:hypothetical protein